MHNMDTNTLRKMPLWSIPHQPIHVVMDWLEEEKEKLGGAIAEGMGVSIAILCYRELEK